MRVRKYGMAAVAVTAAAMMVVLLPSCGLVVEPIAAIHNKVHAQAAPPAESAAGMGPLEDVVRAAAAKSTLDAAGGTPFHMKATIYESKTATGVESKSATGAAVNSAAERDPQWDATVEEWWVSPTEWRREFHSANFSQTLVVNGKKREETDISPVGGTAYPELLRNLTVELVNTVPRLDELAALQQQIQKPDGQKGQIRARYVVTGTDGTVSHDIQCSLAMDRATGLMTYGGNIDWDVSLHDFADFHGKEIARRLTAQAQGGPTLTAQMNVLEDLPAGSEGMFKIHHATPKKKQLRVEVVPELEMRKLLVDAPAMVWPAMSEVPKPTSRRMMAKQSGSMTMRVVVRRDGTVDSADLYFSDNAGLQKWAEEQVMKWKFKPYKDADGPVQVITTMTFPFALK